MRAGLADLTGPAPAQDRSEVVVLRIQPPQPRELLPSE